MTDLLFLTFNRLTYTRESFTALLQNTADNLVDRIVVYDENSTDGAYEWMKRAVLQAKVPVEIRRGAWGGPVAVMNHYVDNSEAELFVKIDSDTIVPPGWLEDCCAVMQDNPHLDLLGIEPPWSRTGNPRKPRYYDSSMEREMSPGQLGWVPWHCIGGIGAMRHRAFRSRNPMHADLYMGFTSWQLQHRPQLECGWIAPALKLFLLDRLPMEPWRSLSAHYIDAGWQRPWNLYEPAAAEHLWSWWTPAYDQASHLDYAHGR